MKGQGDKIKKDGRQSKKWGKERDLEVVDEVHVGQRANYWNNKTPVLLKEVGKGEEETTLLGLALRNDLGYVGNQSSRSISILKDFNQLKSIKLRDNWSI